MPVITANTISFSLISDSLPLSAYHSHRSFEQGQIFIYLRNHLPVLNIQIHNLANSDNLVI